MKPFFKVLILTEATICFGPLFLFLAFGVIFLPMTIIGVFDGELSGLIMLAFSIGGILGSVAIFCVLSHILDPEKKFLSPTKLRIFIVCGILTLTSFTLTVGLWRIQLLWVLVPLGATIHFIYLARNYVFNDS